MTATLSLSEKEANYVAAYYSASSSDPKSEYILFSAQAIGCSVTIYKKMDKNGLRKVVFQGPSAVQEASLFGNPTLEVPKKEAKILKKNPPIKFQNQIGSDEVGTGDFFGPIVVCGAYVDEKGLPRLLELGVTDSKKMSDNYILSIGPELSLTYDHSLLVLRNPKYNEVYSSGINMNAMKAKMHNQCLLNLAKRHPLAKRYQDQFAEENLYYHYLQNEDDICRNIVFATKGETKFPSVALGSVLARYAFLSAMKKMSEELGCEIPLGAGAIVDSFAQKLVEEKGLQYVDQFVKKNFANYRKLKQD